MWTKKTVRGRAKLAKTVKQYPSNLANKEWGHFRPLILEESENALRYSYALEEREDNIQNFLYNYFAWQAILSATTLRISFNRLPQSR